VTPTAIAFCPATPLLSPEISVSDTGLADVRAAARQAVATVLATAPDEILVIGAAPRAAGYEGSYDWRGFGLPATGRQRLPRPLGVGAWLLDDAGWTGRRRYLGVPADTPPDACADLGRELLVPVTRTAVLCIGDGTARRTPKAPGHFDPRAEPFDADVAAALRVGDPKGLLAIDAATAADLLAEGRSAWQVTAALAEAPAWAAQLLHDDAPYGVAWFVATWLPAPTS
jgi:hypothetical protein